MTQAELSSFRSILEARQAELAGSFGRRDEIVIENSAEKQHLLLHEILHIALDKDDAELTGLFEASGHEVAGCLLSASERKSHLSS